MMGATKKGSAKPSAYGAVAKPKRGKTGGADSKLQHPVMDRMTQHATKNSKQLEQPKTKLIEKSMGRPAPGDGQGNAPNSAKKIKVGHKGDASRKSEVRGAYSTMYKEQTSVSPKTKKHAKKDKKTGSLK
jgi:hypothetical protein